MIFLMGISLCFSGCKQEDDPQVAGPSLALGSPTYDGVRGESIEMSLTLEAAAGLQGLTVAVDGGNEASLPVNPGSNFQELTYTFDIPANATLGQVFSILFRLTDVQGNISEKTVSVSTRASLTAPTTYVFERNGQSTVFFQGQTDRLNMLAEIKSKVLAVGDAGGLIDEQVLLNAFENQGENGGGLFSFTSDRQLKDKTFQPDLDERFFETLFAEAAQASLAGSQGVQAANGTAGLITRENSGKTILVDEHGREYTQLIEKGLMGAVFLNQIFNVYLTEARTGDAVENVLLREGTNYTDMEHHWDEAFGYFHPPLDFTSPWPEDRRSELRFWSNYSNVVDNVQNGLLGTNKAIMDAFITGRTAIVNQDVETKNAQRAILYEQLEWVAAATAVHYINSSLKFLDEGKIGETFHVLSEAWAFTRALRYSPQRQIDLADITEMLETHLGAEGNFWNVSAAGLNQAKDLLVTAYPILDPIKNEL